MSSSEKLLFTIEKGYHSSGETKLAWQPDSSNYLASCDDQNAYIWSKQDGDLVDQLVTTLSPIISLSWSSNGRFLLIYHENHISIWSSDKTEWLSGSVSLGLKNEKVTAGDWFKDSQVVVLGTNRGGLVFYYLNSKKKLPVMGKHKSGILTVHGKSGTVVSQDGRVSVWEMEDEVQSYNLNLTLTSAIIESYPAISTLALFARSSNKAYLSLFKKEEHVTTAMEPTPVTSCFHSTKSILVLGYKQGRIASYEFNTGSLNPKPMFGPIREHKSQVHSVHLSETEIATVGDAGLRIRTFADVERLDTSIEPKSFSQSFKKVVYSRNGQLVSVIDSHNSISTYICQMPTMASKTELNMVYLENLTTLFTTRFNKSIIVKSTPEQLDCNDSGLVAYSVSDKVYFHDKNEEFKQTYFNKISKMQVNNDHVACLIGTKLILHVISKLKLKELPEEQYREFENITDFHLLENFVAMIVNEQGSTHITYLELENYNQVQSYKTSSKALKLYGGKRSIFTLIVVSDGCLVYNPLDDNCQKLDKAPRNIERICWNDERSRFIIQSTDSTWYVYQIIRESINKTNENSVKFILSGEGLGSRYLPLNFLNLDEVECIELRSNQPENCNILVDSANEFSDKEEFKHYCNIGEYESALGIVDKSGTGKKGGKDKFKTKMIIGLAHQALECLDFEFAGKCYSILMDAGKVEACKEAGKEQRWAAAAGRAAMLRSEIDLAQQLFENSGRSNLALELCAALGEYDRALSIAEKYPTLFYQIPELSVQAAEQVERQGKFQEAVQRYQESLKCLDKLNITDLESLNETSKSADFKTKIITGIARCTINLGSYQRGLRIAQSIEDPVSRQSIAIQTRDLLKNNDLTTEPGIWLDIGTIFEQSNDYHSAAEAYINGKFYGNMTKILSEIKSSHVLLNYAKAKESDGNFVEAADAYQKAGDVVSVVRMYLGKLGKGKEAGEIALASKSVEACKLVAKYFQKSGLHEKAITFLVYSGNGREAFQIAKERGGSDGMVEYAKALGGDNAPEDELNLIADHFCENGSYFEAGRFYIKAKVFNRGISMLLKDGSEPAISLAVDTVVSIQNITDKDRLKQHLVAYLSGDLDGVQKVEHFDYLLNLYLMCNDYRDANHISILLAWQKCSVLSITKARDFILKISQEIPVDSRTQDFNNCLNLLQSYVLCRFWGKEKDPERATRLLNRVIPNLSKFGSNETQTAILLTAAIESTKAGLKATAFRHAAACIQSPGNTCLDKKKRSILENIIRKASKDDKTGQGEVPVGESDCQFCGFGFDEYGLVCPNCQQTSGMCFASGLRVLKVGGYGKSLTDVGSGLQINDDILGDYKVEQFLPDL